MQGFFKILGVDSRISKKVDSKTEGIETIGERQKIDKLYFYISTERGEKKKQQKWGARKRSLLSLLLLCERLSRREIYCYFRVREREERRNCFNMHAAPAVDDENTSQVKAPSLKGEIYKKEEEKDDSDDDDDAANERKELMIVCRKLCARAFSASLSFFNGLFRLAVETRNHKETRPPRTQHERKRDVFNEL